MSNVSSWKRHQVVYEVPNHGGGGGVIRDLYDLIRDAERVGGRVVSDRWVVTDVRPHVMLCPLPKGFWWGVNFIMRLDSCHMGLHHGHWWSAVTQVGDTHVVLDLSDKTPEEIVTELIEGSYTVWQDYFRRIDSRQQEWIDVAREAADQVKRKSTTKTKIKFDTSAVES